MSPDSVSRCKIRRLPQSDKKRCLPFACSLYGYEELESVCSETQLSTADAVTTFQIAVIYNLVKVLYNCTTFPRDALGGTNKSTKDEEQEDFSNNFCLLQNYFSPSGIFVW